VSRKKQGDRRPLETVKAGFNRDEEDKGDGRNLIILFRHSGQSLPVRPIPNSSSPLRGEDRGGGEINAKTRNPE